MKRKKYEKRGKLGIKIGAKSGNLSSGFRYICEGDGCLRDIMEFRGRDLSLGVFSYIVGSFASSSMGNI